MVTGTSGGQATFSAGGDLARRNAVTDVKPTTTDAGALAESDEHPTACLSPGFTAGTTDCRGVALV
jgi:hypothetical protein